MTIDSSSLYGIMKDLKLVNSNVETFMELADDHWRSFINISKIEGKQNKFTGTIEIDGIAMCSYFKQISMMKLPETTQYKSVQMTGSLQLIQDVKTSSLVPSYWKMVNTKATA